MDNGWFERGTHQRMERRKAPWIRIGPLMLEMHPYWFRLGVVAGRPGYVGVYLGPFVMTFGRRAFMPREVSWVINAVRVEEVS